MTRRLRHGVNTAAERGSVESMVLVGLLFAASVAGFVWVCMGIVASDRWPIRWLEINGSFQRVSAEQLRKSLAPQMGTNFFTVDLKGLEDAVLRIPWVSGAKVQKEWPDTIRVAVREFEPVAHWNRGSLISSDGEAFAVPEADEIQGLPWLQGPDERLEEVLGAWVEFSEKLAPLGLEIQRLRLDRRGSWSMAMGNGTHVQLGRKGAAERLQRLLASWDSLMRERALPPQDIDLRYSNGFAVAWPRNPGENKGSSS